MSNSHFRRFSGVYRCAVCGINTRNTGVQDLGSHLCPDCYELAGMDNHCNDSGQTAAQAGYTQAIESHLANIARKGGNVERVKSCNDYLFNDGEDPNGGPYAEDDSLGIGRDGMLDQERDL